jgi:hypothetical protein
LKQANKMKFQLLATALTMLAGTGALAQVDAARPYSLLYAGSGNSTTYSRDYEFGSASLGAGSSLSTRAIGADATGAPFIQISASTDKTFDSTPSADATLTYSWKITTDNPDDRSPVLVHFHTAGWINSEYGFTPYLKDNYNLNRNYTTLGISAYFGTTTQTVYDQRVYGLQIGALNWGVESVAELPSDFGQQNGGTSHAHGSFSESFDILAVANVQNTIILTAAASYSINDYHNFTQQYSQEHYALNAFIDPIITIDSAYSDRYRIEASTIPTVSVPEPEAGLLLVAGLSLIALTRRVSKLRKLQQH